MTALAGAVARLDALPDRGEERAVLRLRLSRRACQPAEYARRGNAHESLPVEAGVTGQQCGIEGLVVRKIEQHETVLPPHDVSRRRFSGVYSFS